MSTKALPLVPLADWCRSLRFQLGAGVSTTRVFESLAERGPAPIRPLSARLLDAVKSGRAIGTTLEADGAGLPRLFAPMAQVGDETGNLPEVLGELEDYLREEDRLRREIRRQTLLPRIQFFAAIFIVAGLIFILGVIAPDQGAPLAIRPAARPAPLAAPFGLSGTTGAILFLALTLGPIAALWMVAKFLIRSDKARRRVTAIVKRVPVLGGALFTLGLSRFALALQLTLNSSLSPAKALRLSFNAADDGAMIARLDDVLAAVKRGESLSHALALCPRLPRDFLEVFDSAEEAGLIPEAMHKQSRNYRELAKDQFNKAAQLASLAIRLLVIVFVVMCIWSVAKIYLSAIGAV